MENYEILGGENVDISSEEIVSEDVVLEDTVSLSEINENLDTLVTFGYVSIWFIFIVMTYFVVRFVYRDIIMKIINQHLNFRV